MAYGVQSKNVIFKAEKTGDQRVWACAQSMKLNITNDIKETSTPVTGKKRTFAYVGMSEWSVTLGGVLFLRDQSVVKNFALETITETIIDNGYNITITFTDDGGYANVFTGSVLIPSTDIFKDNGSLAKFSIEFKGTGDYTLTVLDTPVITGTTITSDSYTIAAGVITDARWAGLTSANIKEVCREGTEQLSMGLPYTFDEPTRTITPDPGTTMDGQKMFVLWTS